MPAGQATGQPGMQLYDAPNCDYEPPQVYRMSRNPCPESGHKENILLSDYLAWLTYIYICEYHSSSAVGLETNNSLRLLLLSVHFIWPDRGKKILDSMLQFKRIVRHILSFLPYNEPYAHNKRSIIKMVLSNRAYMDPLYHYCILN